MEPESYIVSAEHQQLFREYVDQVASTQDVTSSAGFARFYHRKYQFAFVQEKPVYETDVDTSSVFSNGLDGRYSFHVECRNDSHSFVVEKTGDRVVLLSTRDGQPGTIHLVYETADFVRRIAYIFSEPGRYEKEKSWEYCRTFGFHKPKDIDMPGFTLRVSHKPFV